MKKTTLLTILFILAVSVIYAQDELMFYQAEIFDQNRQPVDGLYDIHLSIWNAVSGGTQLWQQQFTNLTINKGILSVLIGGTVAPFPSDLFSTENVRYMEVRITKGGSTETLSPRSKITSSLYVVSGEQTTACPSGMAMVDYFCIDINRRPPATLYDAAMNCHNRGMKLCTWPHLMKACERNLLDINHGTTLAMEWESDSTRRVRQATWGDPEQTALEYCYKLSDTEIAWYGVWIQKYYRCCK